MPFFSIDEVPGFAPLISVTNSNNNLMSWFELTVLNCTGSELDIFGISLNLEDCYPLTVGSRLLVIKNNDNSVVPVWVYTVTGLTPTKVGSNNGLLINLLLVSQLTPPVKPPFNGGALVNVLISKASLNGLELPDTISRGGGGGGGALPSNTLPKMDGPADAGTATTYSRGDHVHPTDTTRAGLASPAFTGTPTAPTPVSTDNSTAIATTAFVSSKVASVVVPVASNVLPSGPGPASAGTATTYSRGDHVHPVDTTRAALASPAFTGVPTAPTQPSTDNSNAIATTAFVKANGGGGGGPAPSTTAPKMDGPASAGTATTYARGDHVHPTDTTRAPLASPAFTGTPTSMTKPSVTDDSSALPTTSWVRDFAGRTVGTFTDTGPNVIQFVDRYIVCGKVGFSGKLASSSKVVTLPISLKSCAIMVNGPGWLSSTNITFFIDGTVTADLTSSSQLTINWKRISSSADVTIWIGYVLIGQKA